jgi:hypothetical protein
MAVMLISGCDPSAPALPIRTQTDTVPASASADVTAPVAPGAPAAAPVAVPAVEKPARTFEQRVNSHFIDLPTGVPRLGKVERVTIPDYPGAHAIWGGTGRDDRGHIWIGGCAVGEKIPSAHLFEYDSAADKFSLRGDIVSQLQNTGNYRAGEGQMKVHSKFVQADDGWLYFASMDEQGEHEDGSRLPTWGSHLWRLRPEGDRWEHLLSAPEGLIAVSGGGRWIYALGYFQHVLYQYDTSTGTSRSIVVGSVDGHISRNFLSDPRGHVYVPRLERALAAADADPTRRDPTEVRVALVEFGPNLEEIRSTPLVNYLGASPTDSHGIIGIAYLADGQMFFTTHAGQLYCVEPQAHQSARVTPLGWFHPAGTAYTPSLFALDGKRYLAGVGRRGNGPFEWLTYDLQTNHSTAEPLPLAELGIDPDKTLLYGSMARDETGNCYLVGLTNNRPLALKVPIIESTLPLERKHDDEESQIIVY